MIINLDYWDNNNFILKKKRAEFLQPAVVHAV